MIYWLDIHILWMFRPLVNQPIAFYMSKIPILTRRLLLFLLLLLLCRLVLRFSMTRVTRWPLIKWAPPSEVLSLLWTRNIKLCTLFHLIESWKITCSLRSLRPRNSLFLWVSSATPKPSLPPPLCLGTAMWKRSPINVSRVESPQLVVCMGCVLGKIYRKQHVAIPIFPSTNTQPSKDACHCLNLDPWIVHLWWFVRTFGTATLCCGAT